MAPLAIDLYCGLGGWAEGFLSEGWDVIGFDIERHDYGHGGYPGQLVIQDILTLHGKQFKNATVIVASPPCQEFSYMAMPWTLAKEKQKKIAASADEQKRLTALFDACFRIQAEASEAAGHHIPMIVENVRGAQKWVGRSVWHYGSYHLWGDVPALMPITGKIKGSGFNMSEDGPSWSTHSAEFMETHCGVKVGGFRFDGSGKSFQTASVEGTKIGGDWFSDPNSTCRKHGSKSNARKAASAMIAKIPLPLSRHIAKCFLP